MANEKRLLDANELMKQLKKEHDYLMCDPEVSSKIKWWEAVCFSRVSKVIEKTPTVDAVEVVHGRWETVSSMLGYLCCSNCKDAYVWDTWLEDGKWNYCPNCGAKMDGDGNG